MSCRPQPALLEFAAEYHRRGGYLKPSKKDADAVRTLSSAYNASMFGSHGLASVHEDAYDFETRGGKVSIYCTDCHWTSRKPIVVFTTRQLAEAVLGLIAEPARQGALL